MNRCPRCHSEFADHILHCVNDGQRLEPAGARVSPGAEAGHRLDELLDAETPMSVARAARLILALCEAVARQRGAGSLNPVLQPRAIFITEPAGDAPPRIKLEAGQSPAAPATSGPGALYTAPEIIRPDEATAAADVYSLGAIAYKMLTGELPFAAATTAALRVKQLLERPRPLAALRPDIPPRLEAVVQRALANDPALRPAAAAQLRHEIETALASTTPPEAGAPLPVRGAHDALGQPPETGLTRSAAPPASPSPAAPPSAPRSISRAVPSSAPPSAPPPAPPPAPMMAQASAAPPTAAAPPARVMPAKSKLVAGVLALLASLASLAAIGVYFTLSRGSGDMITTSAPAPKSDVVNTNAAAPTTAVPANQNAPATANANASAKAKKPSRPSRPAPSNVWDIPDSAVRKPGKAKKSPSPNQTPVAAMAPPARPAPDTKEDPSARRKPEPVAKENPPGEPKPPAAQPPPAAGPSIATAPPVAANPPAQAKRPAPPKAKARSRQPRPPAASASPPPGPAPSPAPQTAPAPPVWRVSVSAAEAAYPASAAGYGKWLIPVILLCAALLGAGLAWRLLRAHNAPPQIAAVPATVKAPDTVPPAEVRITSSSPVDTQSREPNVLTQSVPQANVPTILADTGSARESLHRCPACQAEYALSVRFCVHDGTTLQEASKSAPPKDEPSFYDLQTLEPRKRCPQCGAEYPLTKKFCRYDGEKLVEMKTSPPPAVDTLPMSPIVIGQYRCFARLGEGGMGIVYKAQHVHLKRLSAIKVLLPQTAMLPDAVQMFRREAQLASSINHPNSILIYDYGELSASLFYLAMEFIAGASLAAIIAPEGTARPLSLARVLDITRQVAEALDAAHQMGIIHRDLKPQNVMVTMRASGGDFVKVVDFGIARSLRLTADFATLPGLIVGTPAYMSPEQARGAADLDARSDLYSLGVMVYQMLSGAMPFPAKGISAWQQVDQRAKLHELPPSLDDLRPDLKIPRAVSGAVMRALDPDRERRYPSTLDFLHDLTYAARPAH